MTTGTSVMVIAVTGDYRILLHHRDDNPDILHPGCWAGFGGRMEDGESATDAMRREMLEETGVALAEPVFLGTEVDTEGGGDDIVLFVEWGLVEEKIHLQEGAGVGTFSPHEISQLRLTPFVRRAISTFLLPLITPRQRSSS